MSFARRLIVHIVIHHLEMRACDWSKLHHVTHTKSDISLTRHYCLYEYSCLSILPSLIIHVSLIFLNNTISLFDIFYILDTGVCDLS